jgi:predicted amidophosphoribosyltransferase
MRIPGRWRDGFVLDYHTLESTYIGDDEYGHPMFDTKRSEIGELLYRLKYRSDRSVVDDLVRTIAEFFRSWNPAVTTIIPVPPSRSGRPQQPVYILAEALSEQVGVPVRSDAILKVKEIPELKDVYGYDERLRLLEGAYKVQPSVVMGQNVLLFDDLYRSGATMNAITAVLYDEGNVAEVYALAITRTRSKS